jgi:ketosteroid isomerase-like protein
MSRNNVAVVRRIYEAWATGDFFGVDPNDFDEHAMLVVRQDFPEFGVFVGAKGMATWVGQFLEQLERVSLVAEHIESFGDTVLVRVVLRSAGIASGVEGHNRFFHLFTFRGPKIVRVEAVLREADALQAVGAYGSTTASPENGPS